MLEQEALDQQNKVWNNQDAKRWKLHFMWSSLAVGEAILRARLSEPHFTKLGLIYGQTLRCEGMDE